MTEFDRPCLDNAWRGSLVEIQVAELLGRDWHFKGADWGAWDFTGRLGHHLEVKQSAALQRWGPTKRPSFDIRHRKIQWIGAQRIELSEPQRLADILLCAWHPIADRAVSDHRDIDQWLYFVIPTDALPPLGESGAKTITPSQLTTRTSPVRAGQLRQKVDEVASSIPVREQPEPVEGG